MAYSLDDILHLVGTLDDSPGDNPPRERFREFLPRHIENVGHAREMIESCLRESSQQYSRALQDLVNYTGNYLGFEVEYGRYQGVPGESGHDGLWVSPSGFHVVIETKTSEAAFNIKTATLTGYIDRLVSEGPIESRGKAMGLYVIGKPDPEVSQLEDKIVGQNKTDELRTISTDALLSLAELLSKYDVTHEDALSVIRPSGPSIDPIAKLMARIVEEEQQESGSVSGGVEIPVEQSRDGKTDQPTASKGPQSEGELCCWLTPVSDKEGMTPEQVIHQLVGKDQIYGYGEQTPGRKDLSLGDKIAFYASGEGVVAHAEVASAPDKKAQPGQYLSVPDAEDFPYVFELRRPTLYLEEPVDVKERRDQLEEFEDRDLSKQWAWFVQRSRELSGHDFDVLTR